MNPKMRKNGTIQQQLIRKKLNSGIEKLPDKIRLDLPRMGLYRTIPHKNPRKPEKEMQEKAKPQIIGPRINQALLICRTHLNQQPFQGLYSLQKQLK
jgi:hypothetical protein